MNSTFRLALWGALRDAEVYKMLSPHFPPVFVKDTSLEGFRIYVFPGGGSCLVKDRRTRPQPVVSVTLVEVNGDVSDIAYAVQNLSGAPVPVDFERVGTWPFHFNVVYGLTNYINSYGGWPADGEGKAVGL